MNDILPPKRPLSKSIPAPPVAQIAPSQPPTPLVDISIQDSTHKKPKKGRGKKIFLWIVLSILVCIIAAVATGYMWYSQSILALNASDQSRIRVEIKTGSSPADIGKLLEDTKLIRSQQAFDIYTRLSNTRAQLQAGTYNLSPSESVESIVKHLVSGNVDTFNVTFLPGATLAENKKVLISAGYAEQDVTAALAKTYKHALFQDKPAQADLEGYIYGETYAFGTSATVEEILEATFDHYYAFIEKNNLVQKFKAQDLNLYEGITLASIIQREVSNSTDQKQVAQIFLRRLSIGMSLGSDVTYQYAAKKMGVEATPELNSPYNTRKFTGLPPGPIATPGKSALEAVANPSAGDYLFFLSGDDDVTYYGRTVAEHDANIRDHCQVKCSVY